MRQYETSPFFFTLKYCIAKLLPLQLDRAMGELFQKRNRGYKLHETAAVNALDAWLVDANVTISDNILEECNQANFGTNDCMSSMGRVMCKVMTLQFMEMNRKDLSGFGPFLIGWVEKYTGIALEHLLYGNLRVNRKQNCNGFDSEKMRELIPEAFPDPKTSVSATLICEHLSLDDEVDCETRIKQLCYDGLCSARVAESLTGKKFETKNVIQCFIFFFH